MHIEFPTFVSVVFSQVGVVVLVHVPSRYSSSAQSKLVVQMLQARAEVSKNRVSEIAITTQDATQERIFNETDLVCSNHFDK